MTATAGTTTIEVPIPLRERLRQMRVHERQPYHEVIAQALDALQGRRRGIDPLVLQHRRALRAAARRNRLQRIWLFGSRARGQAGPDADVDILFQAAPGASLFDLGGFAADAEEILGQRVDLLDIRTKKEGLRKRVLADAVPI
jgi:uncharacterized protein